LHEPFFSKPIDLLSKVDGIEFVRPARPDECCGFGGTFSVFEEVVSTKDGLRTRSATMRRPAPNTSSPADSSCLMHQRGCAERIGVPMKFIHIANPERSPAHEHGTRANRHAMLHPEMQAGADPDPSSVTATAWITPREHRGRCGGSRATAAGAPKSAATGRIDQQEAAARFIAATEHEKDA